MSEFSLLLVYSCIFNKLKIIVVDIKTLQNVIYNTKNMYSVFDSFVLMKQNCFLDISLNFNEIKTCTVYVFEFHKF